MRARIVPILYVLAVLLVAGGLATPALLQRGWLSADEPAAADDRADRATPPRASSAATPSLADEVVATNLFSPRRTAPLARYGSDTLPTTPRSPVTKPAQPAIRLFGIGTTGEGATALLDADPRVPGAEIYHAGDPLPGGGRVESIAADHVVIVTREGRQRIRLQQDSPRQQSPVPPQR
ncbi:MAG TPA: type II secretion system protein N [Gemmatimonadaceae bacterium]|nr:type II secretion system protein N [Gemmatimonadaceae bacterium]